jgi:hypothetical protein
MRRGILVGRCLLVSCMWMACGTEVDRPPQAFVQNQGPVSGRCEVAPPFIPNFQPELEWEWTESPIMPAHVQVMMTPVIVDVSGDGTPDIVFNAFAGSSVSANGIMRAIDGATGADLWATTNPSYEVRGTASIAAGDIDFDGHVELCTIPESGNGIICFEHDGTFKFRTSAGSNNYGGPSFGDLDGDGNVEILNGNYVYSHAGVLKWTGSDGSGAVAGPLSFAADLDGDGKQEVLNSRAIYRHTGALQCANTKLGQGLTGAGNFDADPSGEAVVVATGRVTVMDDNCTQLWTANLPGGGAGGAPTIADFDQDGQPEIGVASATRYVVFETNGLVKWSSPTRDSSALTSATVFDLEGDGSLEVIYADETQLRIYAGATGEVRFSTANSSGTAYEMPVVADVDRDGSAEIILAANNFDNRPGVAGIRVFRDKKNGWVSTRRIWNQQAYSVTNIQDDGTIPAQPTPNWRVPGLNTFRANRQGPGVTQPFATPDLVITGLSSGCSPWGEQAVISATILNQGDAASEANLPVAFYAGDPANGGVLLAMVTLESALQVGQTTQLQLPLTPRDTPVTVHLFVDRNAQGESQQPECQEDNNHLSLELDLSCNTQGNQRPVALCQAMTVPADAVTCGATVSVNAGSYDPDNGPQLLSLMETTPGSLSPGRHDVSLRAWDGAASAVCKASVTVVDVTPPMLTVVGNPAPVVECGFALPAGVVASDACSGDLTSRIEVLNFNNRIPGFYAVRHRVQDAAGNTTEGAPRWVTVVDSFAPSLQLLGSPYMELECGAGSYMDPGAEAYDACSGTLTVRKFNSGDDDGDGIPGGVDPDDSGPGPNGGVEGTYFVQYMANDRVWNIASAMRTVRTRDTMPPVLTLNGPANLTHACGENFVDPGVAAADQCYGNLTSSVLRQGEINPRAVGTYELKYTATDSAGNLSAPAHRTVTVVDDQGPRVQGKLFKLWPADSGMRQVRLSDCVIASDACEYGVDLQAVGQITSISSDEPENAAGDQDGDTLGDISLVSSALVELRAERNAWGNGRVYTLHFTVPDSAGNVTSASCQVHVPPQESGWSVDEGPGAGYTVPPGP